LLINNNASSNNSLSIEKGIQIIVNTDFNNIFINKVTITSITYVTNAIIPETCARLSYYYSVITKSCKNCTQCLEGESLIDSCTATTDTTCTVLCSPGSVSLAVIADTPNQCTLCPIGKFASMGNKACQYCKDGYFSNTVGQSTCLRCPEGMSTSMYSGFDICQKVYTLHHIFKLLCLGL